MAYDESLAKRIRAQMGAVPGIVEKKMFGGVGFLVNGNMACGVNGNDMIVRVGADQHQAALKQPHVKVFDMTGRPMAGWVMVEPGGLTSDAELKNWIERGLEYAKSLPAKAG